mgnify:CR=1 FL=1
MLLPQLRRSLKNINSNNQSLQDIVKSCSKATEVLSVEPYNGKVHNTKITLLVDKGSDYPEQERYEERVHFYNRVALNKAIPANAVYPKTTVEDAIEVLNLQYGCDFTEDDVEFVERCVLAIFETGDPVYLVGVNYYTTRKVARWRWPALPAMQPPLATWLQWLQNPPNL